MGNWQYYHDKTFQGIASHFISIYLQMILRNLKHFNATIQGDRALFQIDTLLAAPDVVLHPAANEVYKMVLQSVRDCVEGWVLYEMQSYQLNRSIF